MSSIVVAAGMLIATTIMILPLTLLLEQPWTLKPDIVTWAALLGLGLFSTAIAFLIYFHILGVAGATNVHMVTFLIPIIALLLSIFILNKPLNWNVFAGMILIFVRLLAIDGRLFSPSWRRYG